MTAYLPNSRNLVRTATLTASSHLPSTAIRRTDTAEKSGGGRVSLGGAYTGASDATIDVQVLDNGGSTPAVSKPAFRGVGSGELGSIVADPGVDPQIFTVTLEDLGTVTRQAYAPFQNVTLRARDSGPDGNLITLSIDTSALVFTATGFAVRNDMTAGTAEFVGDQYNFGAVTLNIDGTIPANAPRISFGDDPQVYRPWRKYVQGRYVYGFSPTLVRDVPAGVRVKSVTGARTVTITDGSITDTLTDVVTLYDCLREIRDNSTLVEVDGVIVNDLSPNGQASSDLSVFTRPYVARTIREGTDYIRLAEVPITVDESVPTEVLEIQCVDIGVPGREKWRVYGQASNRLADAVTGELYADGGYSFRIPRPAASESNVARGTILVEFNRPGWDGVSTLPAFCPEDVTLGPAAVNGKRTFTYRRRPEPDCTCEGVVVSGSLSPDCIGIIPEEDIVVTDESRKRRLQRLADWVDSHVRSNTGAPGGAADSVDQDIVFVRTVASILSDCLARVVGGELSWPAWLASTAFTVDTIREPSTRNGYRYAVTVPGTSDSSEPTWPTTVGDTVVDGTVTWECVGKLPFAMWDDVFALAKDDAETLLAFGDTTVTEVDNVWEASTAVSSGHLIHVRIGESGGGYALFRCTTGGTTASTVPTWPTEPGETVADGTAVWTRIGGDSSEATPIDESYYQRYRTACGAVLAAAEIAPDFEGAGTQGDGCWRDIEGATYWWAGTDSYAPIFTNVFYHSSKLRCEGNSAQVSRNPLSGNVVAESTREFAFAPKFGCEELLQEGDEITITINGVNGVQTYQAGDVITADVTRAIPVEFGGGQTGNDTQTFSVIGSVDGRLLDYELYTPVPVAYDDGGVSFLITPGGIDFALGDTWTFAVEGGRFQWRKNGGSWSSATDIDAVSPVTLGDGLTAVFSAGTAPSWVPGDTWSFEALAVNGPDQLRQPTPEVFSWASSQQLVIEPASADTIDGLYIAEHSIPQGATITIEGSDDNFVSTPLNAAVPWASRNIWLPLAGDYAKYRLTINQGGSIRWLLLGEKLEATMRNGLAELGRAVRRHRLPSLARRSALGVQVEHAALAQSSVDDLLAAFDHAAEFDEGLLGVLLGGTAPLPAIVRLADDQIEVEDVFEYQPAEAANRLLSVTVELEAVA